MGKRVILQGDVYVCDLKDGVGSEQNGDRPCIIIQLNILNKTSKNVIVVPITSQRKKALPTHLVLNQKDYQFLNCKTNTVLCENIRSISKSRLKKYLGAINEDDLARILKIKEYAFISK